MALGVEAPIRDLGPGVIQWDPSGVNLNLYPTNGAISFKSELITKDVHEDGHGDIPVDKVTMGRMVTVEIDLTRQDLTNLEAAVYGSTAGVNNLVVTNKVGQALYDTAKQAIIKPLEDGDTISVTNTEWIYLFKVVLLEAFELAYNREDQRTFKVILGIFPDDTSGNVGALWRIGPA